MKNDIEDIVYRCKDCDKYSLCEYYHGRKETSQICKYFKLAERKTGKWIPHPSDRTRDVCSSCRLGCQRRSYGINPDGTEYVEEVSYQYCPWCGAKMEVADDIQ